MPNKSSSWIAIGAVLIGTFLVSVLLGQAERFLAAFVVFGGASLLVGLLQWWKEQRARPSSRSASAQPGAPQEKDQAAAQLGAQPARMSSERTESRAVAEKFDILIEYAGTIKEHYIRLVDLPEAFKGQFKARVCTSTSPVTDAPAIADELLREWEKQQNPYDDPLANRLLRRIREEMGDKAAEQFSAAMAALGVDASPQFIFDKIQADVAKVHDAGRVQQAQAVTFMYVAIFGGLMILLLLYNESSIEPKPAHPSEGAGEAPEPNVTYEPTRVPADTVTSGQRVVPPVTAQQADGARVKFDRRILGHDVRTTCVEMFRCALLVDGREMLKEEIIIVDSVRQFGASWAVVGTITCSGNICVPSPFVLSITQQAEPKLVTFDGCMGFADVKVDGVTCSSWVSPVLDGVNWEWTPWRGPHRLPDTKWSPDLTRGWEQLQANGVRVAADDLFNYGPLAVAMLELIGEGDKGSVVPVIDGVSGPSHQRGDLLVAHSCRPHACNSDLALIVADLREHRVYLAWKLYGEAVVQRPDPNLWPAEALQEFNAWAGGLDRE